MTKKIYNITIQLMRGLAVIMVVLQHSISRIAEEDFEFKIMYFLNHINVAVFFIISGYLFEIKKEKYYQESKLSYIKGKVKNLIFPYLFWSLFLAVGIKITNMLIKNVTNIIGIESWSWKDIIFNTLLFKDYNVQHLWFIYILFFFFLLNRLFKDILINKKVFGLLFFVSIILNHIKLNYILDKFVLHFIVFLIGRFVAKYNLLQQLQKWYVKIIALCVLGICFLSEMFIENSFTYTYLGNTVYAVSGVCCIYMIAKFLTTVYSGTKIELILRRIGDYSFEIYLMHNPYVSMLVPIILGKIISASLVIVIITTILGIIIPYYVAKIIFYYSDITIVLFGRKGKKKCDMPF